LSVLRIPTAEVFDPLLQPARYKGAYGGRGSGKSQFFGDLTVEDHLAERGMLTICIREVQKSLAQSSKRLIEGKLQTYGLDSTQGFRVFRDVIETPGDGLIAFQGMQDHTAESIKSLEGFKVAWAEEAHTLSSRSLTLLRPTIRAAGSELRFSWNPRRKTDAVDHLLRGLGLPSGAVVVRANWSDNPWFPAELEQERQDDLRDRPEQYEHIWEGEYEKVSVGAYYAASLTAAKREGRICRVARDPLMQVRAVFDIGGTGAKADAVAIWIVQFIGREIRALNYHEAVGQPLSAHVEWLRSNGYDKALCILPHDGAANDKVYDVSYESYLRDAGFETLVIPNQGKGAASIRIETSRRLFPMWWFNEATTEAGRDALGAYHERKDEARGIGLGPEHDWSSHGADAFGLTNVAYEKPVKAERRLELPNQTFV
jgi:phage terminase large subunit